MAKNEKAKKEKNTEKAPGPFSRIGGYFHDIRIELKRVVWPTRAEVINSSIVVVVTLIFFMIFTTLVDTGIVPLLNLFSSLVK